MEDFVTTLHEDLHGNAAEELQELVGDTAERTKRALYRLDVEPGTADAFKAYIICLQAMYKMGMAVQLKAMGYHMTKL